MSRKKRLKHIDKAIYNVLSGKATVRAALFGLPEKTFKLRTLLAAGLALVFATAALIIVPNAVKAQEEEQRQAFALAEAEAARARAVHIAASELVPTPTPTPTPTPKPTPSPTPDPFAPLRPEESDPRVAELQARLMELDYMEADEPTDFYGGITKYSLQLFQREHGLQVDGIAGSDTLRSLYSEEALPYVTRLGDRGTDVEEFQKRLRELRFLDSRATGYFGSDTEKAVKAFQHRNKLKEDGKIGAQTREAIYSADAKAARVSNSGSGSSGSSSGSSSKRRSMPAINPPNGDNAAAMINYAKAYLGYPYDRGGKGPTSFDCSGFVYWCLKNNGVSLKYMTSSAWANASLPTVTSFSKLEAGDIICFKGHVGIYMGGGQMIDASSSNGKVRIASNISKSSYWSRNFICAKRVY